MSRNASASPSTIRTLTPTSVSQTIVFHSTRRKSPLADELDDSCATPTHSPPRCRPKSAEVGQAVLDVEDRRVDVEADQEEERRHERGEEETPLAQRARPLPARGPAADVLGAAGERCTSVLARARARSRRAAPVAACVEVFSPMNTEPAARPTAFHMNGIATGPVPYGPQLPRGLELRRDSPPAPAARAAPRSPARCAGV